MSEKVLFCLLAFCAGVSSVYAAQDGELSDLVVMVVTLLAIGGMLGRDAWHQFVARKVS